MDTRAGFGAGTDGDHTGGHRVRNRGLGQHRHWGGKTANQVTSRQTLPAASPHRQPVFLLAAPSLRLPTLPLLGVPSHPLSPSLPLSSPPGHPPLLPSVPVLGKIGRPADAADLVIRDGRRDGEEGVRRGGAGADATAERRHHRRCDCRHHCRGGGRHAAAAAAAVTARRRNPRRGGRGGGAGGGGREQRPWHRHGWWWWPRAMGEEGRDGEGGPHAGGPTSTNSTAPRRRRPQSVGAPAEWRGGTGVAASGRA